MSVHKFVVAGTPVAKGRPRFARMGSFIRAYTPKKTRMAEESIAEQIKRVYGHSGPLSGPVAVSMKFLFPLPKAMRTKKKLAEFNKCPATHLSKPDLDNLAKSYSDAMNGIVWTDDKIIVQLCLSKEYTTEEEGYAVIEVKDI